MLNHLTDPVAASSNYSELCDTTSIPGEFAFTSVEDCVPNKPGQYQLKYDAPEKVGFLGYERWLADSVVTLTAAMDSTCS